MVAELAAQRGDLHVGLIKGQLNALVHRIRGSAAIRYRAGIAAPQRLNFARPPRGELRQGLARRDHVRVLLGVIEQ